MCRPPAASPLSGAWSCLRLSVYASVDLLTGVCAAGAASRRVRRKGQGAPLLMQVHDTDDPTATLGEDGVTTGEAFGAAPQQSPGAARRGAGPLRSESIFAMLGGMRDVVQPALHTENEARSPSERRSFTHLGLCAEADCEKSRRQWAHSPALNAGRNFADAPAERIPATRPRRPPRQGCG